MADRELGFFDYVRGAFNARVPLRALGGLPFNWLYLMSVGALGLANPGFWLVGLGLELGYLALLSDNPRFRKFMDATALAARRGDWAQRKRAMLADLPADKRSSYEALERKCLQLAAMNAMRDSEPAVLDAQTYAGLDRLLWVYLKLLLSLQSVEAQLRNSSQAEIEKEIAAYDAQLKRLQSDPTKERVAKSLSSTLDITRKRLANLQSADEKTEFMRAELQRIEQQVALMIEESALSKEPTFLSERVDAVSSTLNETRKWMQANADVLGAGADELDAAPPIVTVAQ